MIDLIISATVGAIAGGALVWTGMKGSNALLLAALRDCQTDRDQWIEDVCKQINQTISARADFRDANAAHTRAADALATKQARIDRALACETPKAAHGVRKMARLLRGEEA